MKRKLTNDEVPGQHRRFILVTVETQEWYPINIEMRFNLDDLEPSELLVTIKENIGSYPGWQKRLHRRDGTYGEPSSVGIKFDALVNWRRLEARLERVRLIHSKWNSALWGAYSRFFALGKEHGASEVWFLIDDDYVIVYDGAVTTQRVEELITRAKTDLKRKPFVLKDNDLIELRRIYERAKTFEKRTKPFKRAFYAAVEARLLPFVNKKMRVTTKRGAGVQRQFHLGFYETYFHFTNEGREYTMKLDSQGLFEWTGEIYSDQFA